MFGVETSKHLFPSARCNLTLLFTAKENSQVKVMLELDLSSVWEWAAWLFLSPSNLPFSGPVSFRTILSIFCLLILMS